jgi:hypothetical protein
MQFCHHSTTELKTFNAWGIFDDRESYPVASADMDQIRRDVAPGILGTLHEKRLEPADPSQTSGRPVYLCAASAVCRSKARLSTAAAAGRPARERKNLREHYVPNITGVIITTNHKSDGIFLPADDRRHFLPGPN